MYTVSTWVRRCSHRGFNPRLSIPFFLSSLSAAIGNWELQTVSRKSPPEEWLSSIGRQPVIRVERSVFYRSIKVWERRCGVVLQLLQYEVSQQSVGVSLGLRCRKYNLLWIFYISPRSIWIRGDSQLQRKSQRH
jgi:hypothetical protein